MDPKSSQQGTSQTPVPPPPEPQQPLSPLPVNEAPPPPPQAAAFSPAPIIPQEPPPTQTVSLDQNQPAAQPIKGKKGISKLLLVFLGIVFLAVYALFWTKIFNLKLPFLP